MRWRVASLMALAIVGPATAAETPDPAVTRLLALFDDVCLQAFPDDAAVDAVMAAKGAVPLTDEQVRVTFRDDPGRGWVLADEDGRRIQIMLELPPYHACSVRRGTAAGLGNYSAWNALVARFSADHPGMRPDVPRSQVTEGIRIEANVDFRPFPDGGRESLMVLEQRVVDEARRAAGETGVDLRFVRQEVHPPAGGA